MDNVLFKMAVGKFRACFGAAPTVAAFAPGRIEVLGNHTDYNEGFVLSAAIDLGTFFLASPAKGPDCRLVAGDLMQEVRFQVDSPHPSPASPWANYVKGVLSGLVQSSKIARPGFNGLFLSNIPLAAGLSSSAALEMSSGLALSRLCNTKPSRMDLARIGQKAEHEFAGVKCGLMDQITSLFGSDGSLVMTDFRTLDVKDIQLGTGPSGETPCFVVCNTGVKHTLVDSEYNERRARCEEASAFFRSVLDHPVTALRDVSWKEWQEFSPLMNPTAARRAAHIIGENARVLQGVELLTAGNLRKFGELMFESHDSSRKHFENSCPELDFVVDGAMSMATVSGARLSGGGFGGCAIILTGTNDSEEVGATLSAAFEKRFAGPCACMAVQPSAGGRLVDAATGI